jgi:hypothetical protein
MYTVVGPIHQDLYHTDNKSLISGSYSSVSEYQRNDDKGDQER